MDYGPVESPPRDRALAYSLARVALGLNIAIHGLVRIGHIVQFAGGLKTQFVQTFLPEPLVVVAGYGIVIGESCIGLLVLFNLLLRPALVMGTILMLVLQFGTCLRQDWNAASIQLIYIGFYAALLATYRYHSSSAAIMAARETDSPRV